jgi:hypothetical protein
VCNTTERSLVTRKRSIRCIMARPTTHSYDRRRTLGFDAERSPLSVHYAETAPRVTYFAFTAMKWYTMMVHIARAPRVLARE